MVDHNDLKTDIALIKKDISQIEKTLGKLDSTLDRIANISKTLAIQERIVENHEKRLDDIDDKISRHHKEEEEFRKQLQAQLYEIGVSYRSYIEEFKTSNIADQEQRHREIMESMNKLHKELKEKNKEQDERLSKLENWRWWIMGVGATVATGVTLIWKNFFS